MKQVEIYDVFPKDSENGGIAENPDLDKHGLFSLPKNELITNWEIINFSIIKGFEFEDFQFALHSLFLFSQPLKDIIDELKSPDDKIQWLDATVEWNGEVRSYYIPHFYELPDVLDYELSGWDGMFCNNLPHIYNKEKIRNHNIFVESENSFGFVIRRNIMKEIKRQKLTGMEFDPAFVK